MCGIFGSSSSLDPKDLDLIKKKLSRRGPDGQQSYSNQDVCLVHSRLKIIDLSEKANQPMVSGCGRYIIVFNGEIYNYKQLKKDLINDYDFVSNSDSEVLLYAYVKYGEKCLSMLNGIFAFCIYDKFKRELFLARDRYGVKPLYYCDSNEFFFSSNINCIRPYISSDLNNEALVEYFHFSTTLGQNTFYRDIKQLEAGCYLRYELKNKSIKCISTFKKNPLEKINKIKNTNKYLTDAVLLQNEADVKKSLFLSGGLDSSVLAAMFKEINSELDFLTCNFNGENKSDVKFAKKVCDATGKKFNDLNINLDFDLIIELKNLLIEFGQPLADPAIVPLSKMYAEIQDDIKVIYQGDGGDEVFGGYKYYRRHYGRPFFRVISPFFKFLNKKYKRKVRSLHAIAQEKNNEIFSRIFSNLLHDESVSDIFKKKYNFDEGAYIQRYNKKIKEEKIKNTKGNIQKNMLLDQEIILVDLYNRKTDLASMYHSKEARVPLLDNNLVDHLNSMNQSYKVSIFSTKLLMRKIARKYFNFEFKGKRGFATPVKKWLKDEKIKKYILAKSKLSSFLCERNTTILYEDFLKLDIDNTTRLWQILCFLIWEFEVEEQ
tara:strand:+ start:1584 stop:3386 length:1803 start_codon:yes stop_codon:yes gene_type:complete